MKEKGQQIRRHLAQIPQVESVSGKGLFLAAHFKDEATTAKVQKCCMDNGFITFWLLFNHTALALTPPLTATKEEIDLSMEVFRESVREALA